MKDWPLLTTTSTAAPMSSSGATSHALFRIEKVTPWTTLRRWVWACVHSCRRGAGAVGRGLVLCARGGGGPPREALSPVVLGVRPQLPEGGCGWHPADDTGV